MSTGKANLNDIIRKFEALKTAANDLMAESHDFPALNRNMKRVMASLKMIEINLAESPDF